MLFGIATPRAALRKSAAHNSPTFALTKWSAIIVMTQSLVVIITRDPAVNYYKYSKCFAHANSIVASLTYSVLGNIACSASNHCQIYMRIGAIQTLRVLEFHLENLINLCRTGKLFLKRRAIYLIELNHKIEFPRCC